MLLNRCFVFHNRFCLIATILKATVPLEATNIVDIFLQSKEEKMFSF